MFRRPNVFPHLRVFVPALFLLGSAVDIQAQPGIRSSGNQSATTVSPIPVLPAVTNGPSYSVNGQWVDSYSYVWNLSNTGTISGTVTGPCPPLWSVTGTATATTFTLVAHKPAGAASCVDFQYSMTFSSATAASGTWMNLEGSGSGTVTMTKTCDLPTSETTAFDGWDGTTGKWKQTLISSSGTNFSGMTVQESDAGSGVDGCWFDGSAFAKFDAITGGTWTVNADNTWGDDFVGWFSNAVTYYRAHGRAPCGTSFLQQMTMKCGDGSFQKYGPVNTLKGSMTATTVTSVRVGGTATRRF